MTEREKIKLKDWCMQAVIAVKFQDTAEKNEQVKILKGNKLSDNK